MTSLPKRDYSIVGPEKHRAVGRGLVAAEWYHTEVPRTVMKELRQRSDGQPLRDNLLWLGSVLATGIGGMVCGGKQRSTNLSQKPLCPVEVHLTTRAQSVMARPTKAGHQDLFGFVEPNNGAGHSETILYVDLSGSGLAYEFKPLPLAFPSGVEI